MGFSVYNTATNVANTRRNVAFDINIWIRDVDRACPTSNTTSTGAGAGGTGKTDAITKLQTIPDGIEDKFAFFGYRFRGESIRTAWV